MTVEQSDRSARSRRNFLRGAVCVGGGIGAVSFARAFGVGGAQAADAFENDIATILNLATTAETLAVTLYYTVLTNATFQIGEDATEYLKLAMDAELHHLQILGALGGRALTQQFYMPQRIHADASVFVNTGLQAETVFAGAYLAATHRFAVLGQPHLAATAAQHGASEAQHLTLIRHLAGMVPNDLTMPAPLFTHESDAALALAPFLQGGAGFAEPLSFPSSDKLQVALGGTVAAYAQPFAQARGHHTMTAGPKGASCRFVPTGMDTAA
jgi:hypothetical protein